MKNKKGCIMLGCLIWLLIVIVFFIGIIVIVKLGVNVLFSKQEIHTEEYIVQANDTLWNIAWTNKKDKQDVREYVHQLRQLNNIDCIIHEGQTLKVIK